MSIVLISLLSVLCLQRASVYKDSVHLYRDASAKSPNKARTLNNLGDALVQSGRFDEARAPLERALEITPNYPDALCNLGAVANRQGRLDEAIRLFGSALALEPEHLQARFNLAMLYFDTGMFQDSAVQFRMIRELTPWSTEAFFAGKMLKILESKTTPGVVTKDHPAE